MLARRGAVRPAGDVVRDVRFKALRLAIETRWPGSRVVWEPYVSPDDPAIRGWVHILHVPDREVFEAGHLAVRLACDLFPGPSRFFVRAVLPEHEASMLRRLRLRPGSARDGRRRRGSSARAPSSARRRSVRARARA